MRNAMMLLALVALAVPAQAERLTVTLSWLEQDVYHAEHPTSEVYLYTEGCMEVVQKEPVVLDMEPGPPAVVRLLFHGGEVECRVVKAMADGQVAEEKRNAELFRSSRQPLFSSRRDAAVGPPAARRQRSGMSPLHPE